jgi:serine/threonine-protein kinase
MNLEPGLQLLHYRLAEKIGEGGMGVVWLARDTSLDRDVAIKVLPAALAGEPERMARFEREARMLASLDHPNIAAVYGLHESNGTRFIAMEYIPGEDLAERLVRGPLSIEDTIDIAGQVAEALEAAHEQGVIHRDLKPANIKRTPDGKIKVLDLGLAKALATEMSGESPSVSLSPTVTSAGTVAGTLLGTAGYMSPEQAKGRTVDRRTDIWAFGVVVHEMLTGRKLFQAETISETLAAVLRDEVSLDDLPAETPTPLVQLLTRCLDRDPRRRLRDIGEARIALSLDAPTTIVAAAEAAQVVAPAAGRRLLPWILVAAFAVVAAVAWWSASSRPDDSGELLSLVATFPADNLDLPPNQMELMALSPDGTTLAVILEKDGESKLYTRALSGTNFEVLPGTESAVTPFFSPDSRWIGFFANSKLKKVPIGGGTPVTVCDSLGNNRGATWGTDDVITFSPHFNRPLMRVAGSGGVPAEFTTIDIDGGERTHRWPQAVPGEDLILYTVGTIDSPESYDEAKIDAIRPSTGERKTILERASMARYVPTGHLIFGREGFLFAVPFDVDRLEVLGNPVPVMENVSGMRASGVVHAGVADNGLLAYVAGASRTREQRLVWRDRDGGKQPLSVPVGGYLNPRISPDRTKVAMQIGGANSFDIWVLQLEQETLTRLTFEGDNTNPVWSSDGRKIAFGSIRDNALLAAYVKAADGSGRAEKMFSPEQLEEREEGSGQIVPKDWSADGSTIIVEYTNRLGANLGAVVDGEFQIILETPALENAPRLSPNEKWLVYQSDETGEIQIFVRSRDGSGGKWLVSKDGGNRPMWSRDGKEIYYRWQNTLQVVSVDDSGGSLNIGRPQLLFDDMPPLAGEYDYDVFERDRFLLTEEVGNSSAPKGVTIVVNWLDELERQVPTGN